MTAELARFAPLPWIASGPDGFDLMERAEGEAAATIGRLRGFHGQFGTFVRALAYLMSMGGDGMRQAAEDAVLSANYLLARLSDVFSAPYPGPCMHEALFDDSFLKGTGVSTLDFAKALIDEGIHPMTIYFPLVVHGAMLVEPTDTESKAALDSLIAVMRALAARAQSGVAAYFPRRPPPRPPPPPRREPAPPAAPCCAGVPEPDGGAE